MWTNLIKRVLNLGKAHAHAGIDALEDPVKMMQLAIQELDEAVIKVTKALSVALANQQRLEDEQNQFRLETISWYQKASIALQKGEEELAQKALRQKAFADTKATEYALLATNAKQAVEQLTEQLDDLKLRLDETKTKQKIYAAKAASATAQKQIAESLGGLNQSALANMERYEDKIKQWEAEAKALTSLNNATADLDKSFKNLENEASIADDLAKIKAELNQKEQSEQQQKMADLQRKFEEMNKPVPPKNLPPNKNIDKLLDDFFK